MTGILKGQTGVFEAWRRVENPYASERNVVKAGDPDTGGFRKVHPLWISGRADLLAGYWRWGAYAVLRHPRTLDLLQGSVQRCKCSSFSAANKMRTEAERLWSQSEATLPTVSDHCYSLDSVHLHWLQTPNQSKSECDRGVSARRVIWWRAFAPFCE